MVPLVLHPEAEYGEDREKERGGMNAKSSGLLN